MWGNLRGWIVSGMMLLLTGGGLIFLSMPPSESAWNKLVPLAFKPVALPTPADTIIPAGAAEGDAGELYKQAIEAYLQNPKSYQGLARVDLATTKLPAIDLVKKATNLSHMKLFEANPTKAITYDADKAWIAS